MGDEYEITWKSGHVERLWASQICWPNKAARDGLLQSPRPELPNIVNFHDSIEVDDEFPKWTLILSANEEDISSIRNVTRAPGRMKGA